jgi:CBS domain containing-hemolysin-like protein
MSVVLAQLLWWLVLAAGCGLAFLYSGLETGIYAMNKIRLELRAEAGSRAARAVQRHLLQYRNFLSVLLIGNNIAHYAATSAVAALFVLGGYGGQAGWYTQAVATPLLFVFCDSLPKNLFQRLSERLVYRFVWLLEGSSILFNAVGLAPLVRGFSTVLLRLTGTREGTARSLAHSGAERIVAEGRASGLLTHVQSVMADRVMHISDIRLRDVMIPMGQVRSASASASRESLIEQLRHHNFSRVPLLDASGQVVGIADVSVVLLEADGRPVSAHAAVPLVLSDHRSVTDSLYNMQRSHAHMAVVAASQGRHVGIVTIKDLVEEIVGDLEAW